MNALSNQVGPYHYADGMLRKLSFDAGRGSRTFKVVIASAYNAGIVGPEHNGIVVLDDDHGQVVLDQHVKEGSGYFGPSKRQLAEFERICAMTDWKEFTAFLKENPRLRGRAVPDIDDPAPMAPDENAIVLKAAIAGTVPGLPGESILPKEAVEAHEDPSVPYAFPHRTRLDIAADLAAHKAHRESNYDNGHLAWNIKVHNFDKSGRSGGHTPNPAFDALWEAYYEENADHILQETAGDALREYLDGEVTSFLGDDSGDFEFQVTGRSGGWLELTKFRGQRLGFDTTRDLVETLLEMDEADLARLYVGVKTFDADIQPAKDLAYHVAFYRSSMEDLWSDPDVAQEKADELGVEGFVHPDRAPSPSA